MLIKRGGKWIVAASERPRRAFNLWALLEFVILIGGVYALQNHEVVNLPPGQLRLLRVLLGFAMAVAVLNLLARAVKWLYERRQLGRRQGTKNFIYGIENVRHLLLGMLVVFTLFSLIGIDFATLFTSLSIVAAAIAIVSKDFVNDLIVGIYHSFTDIFEVGDYVKFYNHRGRVIDIGLLKVKLLNDNDDVIILPNGKVYANEIINHTRRDVLLLSIDFEMDLRSIGNLDELERDLTEALGDYVERIEPDSYLLKVTDVKRDLMHLKFQFRLREADDGLQTDHERQRTLKRQLVRRVYTYVSTHHRHLT